MSRVQLALNVSDVDAAVEFYSSLFATPVNKRRPGYANFEIAEPPLKLVLIEGTDGGTLNHLGVETDSADQVVAAEARLSDTGLETTGVDDTECCYAAKTETWVTDPDGAPWEWYVRTGDAQHMANRVLGDNDGVGAGDGACCAPTPSATTPAMVGGQQADAGCC